MTNFEKFQNKRLSEEEHATVTGGSAYCLPTNDWCISAAFTTYTNDYCYGYGLNAGELALCFAEACFFAELYCIPT